MAAKKDADQRSFSEKAKEANSLGEEVGKIMNEALKKCNKKLKKHGYSVSVTLNFHDEKNKEEINN